MGGYPKKNVNDPYQRLFQYELSNCSFNYEKDIKIGYDIFNSSKENASQYPLYSYKLLLQVYNMNLANMNPIQNQTDITENIVKEQYFELQNDLSTVSTELKNSIIPENLASLEWWCLARREINTTQEYLRDCKANYLSKKYDSFFSSLSNAKASLNMAYGFLFMAEERNVINSNLTNNTKLIYTVKTVTKDWIEFVDSKITFIENTEYTSYNFIKKLYNDSIESYSNGLYYISLMRSSQTKALLEYYSNVYKSNLNYSSTYKICKNYLEQAKININYIHKDKSIDAPMAESMFEQAKLHFQEAKTKKSHEAKLIMLLSIQESMISIEQIKASLDLKKSITNDFKGHSLEEKQYLNEGNDLYNEYTLNIDTFTVLIALVILSETIFIIFIFNKLKKVNN